jgi:hypothetical protein
LHTSGFCGNGPEVQESFCGRTPAPPSRLRARILLQFSFTTRAINSSQGLGTVPKTTAPLANLQLHAHFHDRFPQKSLSPARSASCLLSGGLKGARQPRRRFCCRLLRLPMLELWMSSRCSRRIWNQLDRHCRGAYSKRLRRRSAGRMRCHAGAPTTLVQLRSRTLSPKISHNLCELE